MTTLALLNEPVLAQTHQDQDLGTKEILFAPEGWKAETKRQRQETKDQGEEKGTRERGKGYFSSEKNQRTAAG